MKSKFPNFQFLCVLAFTLLWQSSSAVAGWSNIGVPGFSPGQISSPCIVIDTATGLPFVAFADDMNSSKVSVMKFNGSVWDTVGTAGISIGSVNSLSMTLDKNGTPYVSYTEDYLGGQVCVKKFDGTNWINLGPTDYINYGTSYFASITTDINGTPYVAYNEYDYLQGNRINVQKFDGTNWSLVGPPNFSPYHATMGSISIDINLIPYVCYMDADNNNSITVKKFDGTDWLLVGTEGFTQNVITYPTIRIDKNGTPYVGFADQNENDAASVIKFDGSDWVYVGAAGFSSGPSAYNTMELDSSGLPCVAFLDIYSNFGTTVMKFDGSTWNNIGCSNISGDIANIPSLALDKNDVPYVAFVDNNNYKARVLKYTPASIAISSQPVDNTICAYDYSTIFSINSTEAQSYQWQEDRGSGFANINNSWLYSGANTNTLTLQYPWYNNISGAKYRCLLGGCEPSDETISNEALLTIRPSLISSAPQSTSLCGSDNIAQFTAIASDTNVTYQWQYYSNITWDWENASDDATYSGTNTNSLTVTSPDPSQDYYEYNLVIISSNGCEESISAELTLDPAPQIDAHVSDSSICAGSSVTLWGDEGHDFIWNNGAYNNIPINVNANTTYILSGTSWSGCPATDSVSVSVRSNTLPTPVISSSGPLIFCEGDSVVLTATNTSPMFLWSNGSPSNSITIKKSGNYIIENSSFSGCIKYSLPTEVIVPILPIAITYGDCSGNKITSSGTNIVAPKDYDPTNTCSEGHYIDDFIFAGINNLNSGCQSTTDEVYSYFPNQMATVIQGETYPFTIHPPAFSEDWHVFGIWIDFNNDGDYDDASEMVYQNNNWTNNGVSHAIRIPINTPSSITTMRVRISNSYTLYPEDANRKIYGETEDYPVKIGSASNTMSYMWTSIPAGFTSTDRYVDIAGSIDTTYYFTVTDSATSCVKTTFVTIDSAQTMPAIYGDNVWNAYAYNGFEFDTYEGFYYEPKTSFASTDRWNNGGAPSDYALYKGCTVDPDVHSMKYKRQGFECGIYSLSIPGHDDNCYLYVNDSLVFFHDDCCDSHDDVWTGRLDANSRVEFDWKNGGGGSYGALEVNFITFAPALGPISGTSAFCDGLIPANQTYSVAVTPTIINYLWSVPNGASIVSGNGTNSIEVSYSANNVAGEISVYGISDCGNGFPTTMTIIMDLYPDSAVSALGQIAFCPGGSVDLTASNADSYLWSSGETTPSIIITKGGSYSVTTTNGGGCSRVSVPIDVYIPELPEAKLRQSADCNGNTLELTAGQITSTYPVSYNWTSLPAGFISTDQTPAGTPSMDTTYYLTVIDTILGCTKSSSLSFDSTDIMPAAYGRRDNVWNVYAYNGFNFDAYQGFYSVSTLDFNSTDQWADGESPSYYSGYTGCAVTQDDHSVFFKRKGFACGTYRLNIPNHDDDCQLYINDTLVFEHNGCCDGHYGVWQGYLDANSKIAFSWAEGGGGSLGMNVL